MEIMETFGKTTELSGKELAMIFRQGAVIRLPYLEGRLLKAREQIRRFEEKYRTTIVLLDSEGLPDDAGYEMHEDFIEWEYWNDVLRKTRSTIQNVNTLLEEAEETVGVR